VTNFLLGQEIISTPQEKLVELARIEPKLVLTTLAHHIDEVWKQEAYRRTRKDGAVGIDGVTAAQYREVIFGQPLIRFGQNI